MTSTRGPPFTAPPDSPILRTWAAELNAALPAAMPTVDPRILVHRPSAASGRGTFIADGLTVRHGADLAVYWGYLTLRPSPASRHLLELPPTFAQGRVVQPFLDAGHICLRANPPTAHAAVLNHQCEDPSCSARWHWPPGSTLPIMVCTSRRSLRGGTELTYNYDSHLRSNAFTVGPDAAAASPAVYHPCGCRYPLACPHDRYLP